MADEREIKIEAEEPAESESTKKRNEALPPNTGVILYASLAILLLAFFILLVSMARVDSEKRKEALNSIGGAFGILTGGAGLTGTTGISPGGSSTDRVRFQASITLFHDYVKAKGLEEEAFVEGSRKGFAISIWEGLLFQRGRAVLNPRSYVLLDMVKFVISDGQKVFRVRIEGHTDDQPITSPEFPSNWDLSVGRAITVLRYFLADSGIKPDQLEAAGYGPYKPKVPNDTPENRAKNRRVDFTFLLKEPLDDVDPKEAISVGGFRFTF